LTVDVISLRAFWSKCFGERDSDKEGKTWRQRWPR
jgi:hypothetical protein